MTLRLVFARFGTNRSNLLWVLSASLVRTLAKPQNKQLSAFFEFSKAPLLRKEGRGWFKK
jgi:hypothetical protein